MAFQILHNGKIPYLLAPNLSGYQEMFHAFTTRIGGVSTGNFSSLNLAFHVGDAPEDVITNRQTTAGLFNLQLADTVTVRQVHGTKVQIVTAKDKGQGSQKFDDTVPEGDALVTDVPGILLWCFFADCVPILFYDPRRQVVAVAHAGWRGSQARIAAETVKVMHQRYGCLPQNIQAAIGPSAGPCCYEVDGEVANLFTAANFQNVVSPFGSKYKLDLWQANKQALMEVDVPENNISISRLCTSCLTPLFFSFRNEDGTTGRFAAAISLKA